MSKGSKSTPTPTTSTVVQSQSIPSWLQTPIQQNIDMANTIAARPFDYPTTVRAGLDPSVSQAWNMAKAMPGQQQGTFDTAKGMASAAGGAPPQISAQTYANGLSRVGDYMNPYNQNVVDVARENMRIALGQNINQIGDKAIAAGAFGGSRQGIMEGVAAAEGARQLGDLSAGLQQKGFESATQMIGQDITNNLAAQRANQQSALDATKTGVAGSIALGHLAQSNQSSNLQDIQSVLSAGQGQQAWNQQAIDDAVAKWTAERNYPLEQLNIRMGAVTSSPTPMSSTSTSTSLTPTSTNYGMSALGGAMAGANLGSSLFGGSTAGTIGTSLLGGLLGIFSDENEKTDIQKVGKLPNGLNTYAFRYKGDPKSYPKVVGVMAQDVEKKIPTGVSRIGGKRVVNMNGLSGLSR